MKFLLFILLFGSTSLFSQSVGLSINLPEKTEFNKAILYFNDGTSIEGIGRIKTIFASNEEVIVFKIEANDKDETWSHKDVKGISIATDEEIIHYEYLKTTKHSFAALYEVVTEGNITLYRKYWSNHSKSVDIIPKNQAISNFPSQVNSSNEKKMATYYVKRTVELYPTKIKDNYIKSLAEYMKDCDFLVVKIKDHEYNYSQLRDLVDYYNANCGE